MFAAVIFDLDGTVLDNEDEYGAAFAKVLSSLGVTTPEKRPQQRGIGVEGNWKFFLSKYGIKTKKSLGELSRETQAAYKRRIDKVRVRKGFFELARKLRERNILVALATSNHWEMVDLVFRKLGLEEYFDVVTTVEEAAYSKPDPDLFIKTAEKLGLEREDCVVIEDAPSGIEAAKRAGMSAIGIADDATHAKELGDAKLVIYEFGANIVDLINGISKR